MARPPIEEWLYHFTSKEALFGKILPTMRLKTSTLSSMDDPWESMSKGLIIDKSIGSDVERLEIEHAGNQFIRERIRIACFCRQRTSEQPHGPSTKMRMWSQYGDGHEGVALILDQNKLTSKMSSLFGGVDWFLDDVEYKNIDYKRKNYRMVGGHFSGGSIPEYIRENRHELFFQKNTDYQDEDESRLLIFDANAELIDIEGCIIGIVLGAKFFQDPWRVNLKSIVPQEWLILRVENRFGQPIISMMPNPSI